MDVEVKMKAFACTLQAASSKTLKRTNKNGSSHFLVELVLPIVNIHHFTPFSLFSLFTHILQFADSRSDAPFEPGQNQSNCLTRHFLQPSKAHVSFASPDPSSTYDR